ncbi:HPP family protein [Rhodocyclus gracilis]|uniref:CBS domain-containing protein n=1 Tax=Rhodocyclus tenuis TaxID=1066 RepID=A0A6L5JZ46_RHOTE|nr:CBS domain-containing protein [Rhodocyclus gracilis]MQY52341.1 CBS domain-containing protein [Rhodocyclus gracilis]
MFSIYGLSGPEFRGTLEELGQLPAVNEARRVRAVRGKAGSGSKAEDGSTFATYVDATLGSGAAARSGAGNDAVLAYQSMTHADPERGPLYRAWQVMERRVISVTGDDPAERAYQVLLGNAIRQAPVLGGDGLLIGIVSERNLLTALNIEGGRIRDVIGRRVRDLMTSPVVCADPGTDLRRIAQVMLDDDVDGVPVVSDSGVLVGFVSRSDILGAVVATPPLSLWR